MTTYIPIGCAIITFGILFYVIHIYHKTKSLVKQMEKKGSSAIDTPIAPQDELDDNWLIEFRSDTFSYYGDTEGGSEPVSRDSKKKTNRVSVKPRDVLKELERPPTNFTLDGIESKILILKEKEALIRQRYAKREVQSLILCLENRKKYDKKAEDKKTFREYFSRFDVTDEKKIGALLKKYILKRGIADIFIPEFPDQAIKIMKTYEEKVIELCGKKPVFYVIAEEKDFEKQEKARDPILLVQSPFGFFYYILGAWDKEMLYLPEL